MREALIVIAARTPDRQGLSRRSGRAARDFPVSEDTPPGGLFDPAGKVVVVTGGASGIGKALCHALGRAGARHVVVADIDQTGAEAVAEAICGEARRCDVSRTEEIERLVEAVETETGPIGLFCSNAGIATGFDLSFANAAGAADDVWQRAWNINVMAHVAAARCLVPRYRSRGGGHFLNTVSAAGVLSMVGSAIYSTTKHAALGFAENLAITHRKDGIHVSVLCPQGVATPMLDALSFGPLAAEGVLSADRVADAALDGVRRGQFMILPHPEVATYMRRKTDDYDRWIAGMARMQDRI